jgi:hypothetical protein
VDVSGESGTETFTALIDSGTEVTIMSTQVAQLVGISASGKPKIKVLSFGDSKPGFIAQIRIIVPEFPKEVLTTDVIFSDSVSDGVPYDILLGQEDFFRRFLIFLRSTKIGKKKAAHSGRFFGL